MINFTTNKSIQFINEFNEIINAKVLSSDSEFDISSTYPSSSAFPSGVLVAQQFLIEDNILSAVKAYLHRTTGDDAPTPLSFEIWGNAAKELFNDDFDDWTYLGPSSNVMIEGSKLMLKTNVTETEQSSYYSGAYPQKPYLAQVFLFDNNVSAFKAQFYLGADTEDGLMVCVTFSFVSYL